jgi:4-amino-4-deoxy-L-arabinose transferase-like glycosyltransferase
MKMTQIISVIAIVLVAAILRLWQLGNTPPSPNWDEVALGYNAYSLMSTGRDEYGKFLPIILQSYDDFKPALYAYLTIPAVTIFGLTPMAVRLPSALLGIVTVLLVYILARQLFAGHPKRNVIAFLSAATLAIMPWHIQFSRVAFESNVGVFFVVAFAVLILASQRNNWYLVPAVVAACLSMYVYQSMRLFTPLLVAASVLIYLREILSINRKIVIISIAVGLMVAAPLIHNTLTDVNSLARARGVSILSPDSDLSRQIRERYVHNQIIGDPIVQLMDNWRIMYPKKVIEQYLSHWNPNWLFITGDIARHHPPGMGILYLWQLPILLIGCYALYRGKHIPNSTKWMVTAWILLSPIPASVTSGVPHAVRALMLVPAYALLTGLGAVYLWGVLARYQPWIRLGSLVMICFVVAFSFAYYLNQYFVQLNYFTARDWQYGYAQIVQEVASREANYDRIIVSNREPLDQSYMFFLFYLKYPPMLYQGANKTAGFAETIRFGKYEFRHIDRNADAQIPNALFVVTAETDMQGNIIKTVSYPDGTPAISLVETSRK